MLKKKSSEKKLATIEKKEAKEKKKKEKKSKSSRRDNPANWVITPQTDTFKKLSSPTASSEPDSPPSSLSSSDTLKRRSEILPRGQPLSQSHSAAPTRYSVPVTSVEHSQTNEGIPISPRARAETVGGDTRPSSIYGANIQNKLKMFEADSPRDYPSSNSSTPRTPSSLTPSNSEDNLFEPRGERVEDYKQTIHDQNKEIKRLRKELGSLKTMVKLALPSGPTLPAETDATNIRIVKTEQKDELMEYQKKYQLEVAQRVKLEGKLERYQNMEQKVKLMQEGMLKESENASNFEKELKRMTQMYESEIQKKNMIEVKYHKLVRQTAVLLTFVEHLKHETQLLYRMVMIDLKDKKDEKSSKVRKEFMDIEKYIMVSNVEFRKNFFNGTDDADEFYQQATRLLGSIEKDQKAVGTAEKKQLEEAEEVEDSKEQWELVDVAPPPRIPTITLPKREEGSDPKDRLKEIEEVMEEDSQVAVTHPVLQAINDKYQQKLGTIIIAHTRSLTSGGGISDMANYLNENSEQNNKVYIHVVNELLETEKLYVRDMGILISDFKKPLIAKRIISPFEGNDIFSKIEEIHEVNSSLLLQLEEEAKKELIDQRIGRVFLKILANERFAPYSTYCANQTLARTVINGLKKNNPSFVKHLESTRSQAEKRLEIQCYLIKPMQRICKYPLLMKEMLKYLNNKHMDSQFLAAALAKMEVLLTNINENLLQISKISSVTGGS